MKPVLTIHKTIFLLSALAWLTIVYANTPQPSGVIAMHDEHDWLNFATRLVNQAQGAQTDAVLFNKDVKKSRARLREIVQIRRNTKQATKHRELHSIMLIMDVLLKSAAACQTGGHIVCPPMLMSQLKTVLKNAHTKLDEVKQSSNNNVEKSQ